MSIFDECGDNLFEGYTNRRFNVMCDKRMNVNDRMPPAASFVFDDNGSLHEIQVVFDSRKLMPHDSQNEYRLYGPYLAADVVAKMRRVIPLTIATFVAEGLAFKEIPDVYIPNLENDTLLNIVFMESVDANDNVIRLIRPFYLNPDGGVVFEDVVRVNYPDDDPTLPLLLNASLTEHDKLAFEQELKKLNLTISEAIQAITAIFATQGHAVAVDGRPIKAFNVSSN